MNACSLVLHDIVEFHVAFHVGLVTVVWLDQFPLMNDSSILIVFPKGADSLNLNSAKKIIHYQKC